MAETKEKTKRKYTYKNTSGRNVFTSVGRCGADETVELFTDEGNITKGLEKCKTTK